MSNKPSKDRLIKRLERELFFANMTVNWLRNDKAKLVEVLQHVTLERDKANRILKKRGLRDDEYDDVSARLAHSEAELSIARKDLKILEDALADKKAGNPNWENVAEQKMRKARH
jgi:hypothetical protein